MGQKVLYENHKKDLTRNQKLQQRRLGPFTVTKRITNTTYQITDNKNRTVNKTVHRNHLVEYYPKEGSVPAMIEEYVPSDHQNDNFYKLFMEQRTRYLNNKSTAEKHDSFPFPIEPLRSISPTNKPKRSSMQSNDSGNTSPHASFRTPVLSPAIQTETSTPQPSSSQQAQTAQLSPRDHLSPIQQFIRNSATRMGRNSIKSRFKQRKYNRSQPNYPNPQSAFRTRTRRGYKLWSPLHYCHVLITFILHAPLFSTRDYCLLWFSTHWPRFFNGYDLSASNDSTFRRLDVFAANSFSSYFLHSFTKTIQKAKNIFICCAILKKQAAQLTTAEDI